MKVTQKKSTEFVGAVDKDKVVAGRAYTREPCGTVFICCYDTMADPNLGNKVIGMANLGTGSFISYNKMAEHGWLEVEATAEFTRKLL